ncbi:hypothetical protein [Serratia marcescens]|uniref:hypothetical protein n=1 Tax=Serratia marcescens TaxID=615 RepID=UPI0021BAEDE9|nr:hypothetical protein [Serratia marcescens]
MNGKRRSGYRTLLASGLDQGTVINATGLTVDELAQLRHYHVVQAGETSDAEAFGQDKV